MGEDKSFIFDQTKNKQDVQSVKNDISEVEEMNISIKEFEKERIEVSIMVKKLGGYMSSVVNVANNKHEFYRYRQDVVSKKLTIMNISNTFNRRAIKQKNELYLQYKFGKKSIANPTSVIARDSLLPKNDFERSLYLDSDMRDMNYFLEVINNHLEFITQSLKTIDNMIFGIDYVIKLETFKTT
jgi:hypothetical protein